MGNALRHLVRKCFQPGGQGDNDHDQSLGPHGVSAATVGVSALARDLFHFDNTAQVPDRLSKYVVSSKKAQANWYSKLLAAWKQAKTSPKTPQEASRFITETLKRHKKDDVLGLIAFYGLPISEAPVSAAPVEVGQATHPTIDAGLKFEIITLPVDAKSVSDGDTITVYVDTKDPRESSLVPKVIHDALIKRTKERLKHNYVEADVLQKQITDAGYRIIRNSDRDILAKKYRIRLRGIDAPESSMPYGAEAKEALCNLVEGNSLKIFIYDKDQYGRYVGDIYCHGTFVQEFMLKKGLAWHYIAYDKRPQLTKWENEARAARIGLWAAKDPEKPWEWRRDQKRG